MAFRKMRFRDKKKLFTGIMCVAFGAFFIAHIFIQEYTLSKLVFGGLLLYFGVRSFALAK